MRPNLIFSALMALAIAMLALPASRAQDAPPKPDAIKSGAMLYTALRCGLCHEISASGINIPPSLTNAGDKFQTAWLEGYLKAPHHRRFESAGVRPTLRMPNFLLSNEEARALAAYLSAQHDSIRITKYEFEFRKNDSTIVAEGRQIYKEYACFGCHKIGTDGGEVGPDLNGVGTRLRPEYLAAFLRNPQAFIPDSPMKNFDLWEEEVQALVVYLMSLKEASR
ncbi:c-type cytochrome [candidate division KSB1 bacterium]|nr:c-type cytochrome [candidate division KSB1 bacterium]